MIRISRYFEVIIDGNTYYDTRDKEKILINPVVRPSLTEAGSFDFTIDKNHKYYDRIRPYGSNVIVKEDDEIIFFGRPLPPTKNIFNQKTYHCEGAIAFLNDVICPPMSKYIAAGVLDLTGESSGSEFTDGSESGEITGEDTPDEHGLVRRTITFTQYIEYVFEQYNKYQYKPSRKLYLRNYFPQAEASIDYDSDYKTCLEVLRSEIIPKMGGYLVASVEDEVSERILVDITYNFGKADQPIRAGLNLLDYLSAQKPFYTAVIAKGGYLNNDHSSGNEPIVMTEPLMMDNNTLSKYGVIMAYKEFPECTTMESLQTKAIQFLAEQQFEDYTLEVSAADLHITNPSYESLKVGKIVTFSSPMHHESSIKLLVTGMEIRLDTGEKKVILGDREKPPKLTHRVNYVNVKVENQTESADIAVEDAVIEGSNNPVTSGAVYDALQGGVTPTPTPTPGDGWIHQIDGVTQNTGTINFVTEV